MMKTKIFMLALCFLMAVGCASPPKKERTKLPSQAGETAKPQPPPKENLEELVIPQREEAKKAPEKLFSFPHPCSLPKGKGGGGGYFPSTVN